MRKSISTLTVAAAMFASSLAYAHGPQIQVTNTNGKIITRELFVEEPYGDVLTDPKSVYVMPLLSTNGVYFSRPNNSEVSPGVPQYLSGPGIAFGIGQTFQSGFNFRLSFVDGLKLWNGASFNDPGAEQIMAFRGSFSAPSTQAVTSDTGPYAGFNYPTIPANYNAESHRGTSFALLGDGVSGTSASDDGVYLVSLQLSSTQPNLAASDPYFFVLYKNVALSEAMAAATSLGFERSAIQIVPEASTITLIAVGGGLFAMTLARRRMGRKIA